jgi:predicted acylesterase/phospholipase RssA
MSLASDRLHAPGPKRILALDGGGTRGIVAIAFLERIEELLANATGRGKAFRLAEYFDLIGGTSVGSMLATMLAMGDSVAQVKKRFIEWAPEIFNGRDTLVGVKRFDARKLVNRVRGVVGDDTRLDTDKLVTGLAIVTKRVDTGAVWVLCNNLKLKYWKDGDIDGSGNPEWVGNKGYKLAQLVRASTAAPYHFTPVAIDIAKSQQGLFVDGGVSPHNNPSLLLFLMATIKGYQLNWEAGADKLLIISVGTGHHRVRIDRTRKRLSGNLFKLIGLINHNIREDLEEAAFATETLRSILADCDQLNVKILQGLSNPRLPWGINTELGDLSEDLIGGGCVKDYLLSFQRYNLSLDQSLLQPPFGVPILKSELPALHAIDRPEQIDRLYDLAKQVAEMQVSLEDFASFLPAVLPSAAVSSTPREPAMA